MRPMLAFQFRLLLRPNLFLMCCLSLRGKYDDDVVNPVWGAQYCLDLLSTYRGLGHIKTINQFTTGISCRLPSLHLILSMFSRNVWRTFGQKSFPISPINWTLTSPFPYPPITPAHHPLTVISSICYPTPCLYICGFFKPVVAYFLPLLIIIIQRFWAF